jgi:hypothetical protein
VQLELMCLEAEKRGDMAPGALLGDLDKPQNTKRKHT